MRIPVRTSRLAVASRRLASFGLPLVIIPVFLHRTDNIDSETFFLVEAIGMGLAALGVLFGFAALVRLWITGDQGWGRAVTGLFVGLICLAPFAFGATLYAQYPATNDVSTPSTTDINLVMKTQPPSTQTPRAELLAAFPNLIAREYLLTPNQTYRMVEQLLTDRGFSIISARPPQLERASGQINATETTFLGWTDEIGIAVTRTAEGAEVAVRSASLAPLNFDLGRNGRRIESLLRDLDDEVTDEIRRGVALDAPPIPVELAPR